MKNKLEMAFQQRQYMIDSDFEVFYYSDIRMEKVTLHSHKFYEFYFFLEGEVSLTIEKENMNLTSGDIVVIPPRKKHQALINSEKPYKRFILWVSETFMDKLLVVDDSYALIIKNAKEKKVYIYRGKDADFNTIHSKIIGILEEQRSNRYGREAQLKLDMADLILNLSKVAYNQSMNCSKQETKELTLFERVIAYINNHVMDNLSLEDLEKIFYVSKYHLSHLFKENLGISIHKYIQKKRLYYAKEMLLRGERVSKVYEEIGYNDYSTFYRAFKKEFGINPKSIKSIDGLSIN